MALIECKECKRQVSDKAGKCPNCGAKVKTPTSKFTKVFTVLLVAGVTFGIFGSFDERQEKERHEAALTPEQREQQEKAANDAAKRTMAAKFFFALLKQSARDPDSVKLESLLVNDIGTVACSQYRARNGFGGMNKGVAVMAKGQFFIDQPAAWNKHCTKPMFDVLLDVD